MLNNNIKCTDHAKIERGGRLTRCGTRPPERAHRRPTSFPLHAPRAVRALRVLFDVIVHQCSFSIAPLRLFHRVCLSVRETVTRLHYIITELKIMIRVATGDKTLEWSQGGISSHRCR